MLRCITFSQCQIHPSMLFCAAEVGFSFARWLPVSFLQSKEEMVEGGRRKVPLYCFASCSYQHHLSSRLRASICSVIHFPLNLWSQLWYLTLRIPSPHSVGGPPLSSWGISSGRTCSLLKVWVPFPWGLPPKF